MEGKVTLRGVGDVKGVSDLGLNVGERSQVGRLVANDKMPYEIP